ncbi:ATP synthase in type III secretion protein N [Cupriavidus sp. OV038]|uniref:FliI/YscN family ATPase n=1 Tax=unclassified Cupriavidus TaxID=2640874 RepID=UPI0008E54739|nr:MULTISPECIES: FliI/YscN family ATPase [unclassified Cupriavidus]SFD02609.1 ATP synthase in type III secretion protein N [Cupriavidus sp. OV038]SFP68012.1 ATP synthase in type III secretion protein N [Cupriavidus sp. OV096]
MATELPAADIQAALQHAAADLGRAFDHFTPVAMRGRVSKAVGMLIHATGIQAHVGEICQLVTPGEAPLLAEVVGFMQQTAVLTPLGRITGISALTEVVPAMHGPQCPAGAALLGRVLDALGEPIDAKGSLVGVTRVPIDNEPPDPLTRRLIREPLATGVRAIDGLLTLGEGQRVGIFAPPGVGKSTLLGMLARGSAADVNVVALVGERGREVREFIEYSLGPEGMARTVLVVSTSDRSPMERVRCAYTATAIAEHFRDQGKRVLLLVDSLTRLARAQREIGLAGGEPPTRRSYPPSVFSMLPQLLERAGTGVQGSITAAYTVLTEGEDDSDPIAEEVRSILDGHIVLSRKLASAGQYPPIDILQSVSRVMPQVAAGPHQQDALRLRQLLAKFQDMELLLQIGEYRPGADAVADVAVGAIGAIRAYLTQPAIRLDTFAGALAKLAQAIRQEAKP